VMRREQVSEVGAGRCEAMDLIGVGFRRASSSSASGPIRSGPARRRPLSLIVRYADEAPPRSGRRPSTASMSMTGDRQDAGPALAKPTGCERLIRIHADDRRPPQGRPPPRSVGGLQSGLCPDSSLALRKSIFSSIVLSCALRTSSWAFCNRSLILRSRRSSMSG
jgi:hypothetical protein